MHAVPPPRLQVEYAALETQLRAVATERGLQFVPDFLTKCVIDA